MNLLKILKSLNPMAQKSRRAPSGHHHHHLQPPPPIDGKSTRIQSLGAQSDPFASDHDISTSTSTSSSDPPHLVIEAILDFQASASGQLSFRTGEFFHAANLYTDENGHHWFHAVNPIKALRGLVPCSHFRQYAPNRPTNLVPIRRPSQESLSIRHLRPTWTKVTPPKLPSVFPRPKDSVHLGSSTLNLSDSLESSKIQSHRSLYGIVQYTFQAERPDELTAYAGESVVVIAHSAEEWLVIKPIGRLGGPGFIPASYIELHEVSTSKTLTHQQVLDLIRSSVLPTVEDWKKRVAGYKASSIPLGIIQTERSIDSNLRPGLMEDTAGCDGGVVRVEEQDSRLIDWRQRQALFIESAQKEDVLSLVEEEKDDEINVKDQIANRYGLLWKLNVTSFHCEQGQFWYQVHAHFQTTKAVDRRRALVLYRLDEHFRTLETDLLIEFPTLIETLPSLSNSPRPTDEIACAQRMEDLRDYFEEITTSSESIRTSEAICEFLIHRQGDMDLDYSDSETDSPPIESSPEKPKTPILLIPSQGGAGGGGDQSSNFGEQEDTFEITTGSHTFPDGFDPHQTDSTRSEGVRSWLTSCEAASPYECDFSHEGPNDSTQPSSMGSVESLVHHHLDSLPDLEHTPPRRCDSTELDRWSSPKRDRSNPEDPEPNGYVRIDLSRSSTDETYVIRVHHQIKLTQLKDLVSDQLGFTYDGTMRYQSLLTPSSSSSPTVPSLGTMMTSEPCVVSPSSEGLLAIRSDVELNDWLHSGHRFLLYLD